jgi:hypothetical protein
MPLVATVDDHFAALVSDVEFTRAMGLDALRSLALPDERPSPMAPSLLPRLVALVTAAETPERDRLVEFLSDLADSPPLAESLEPDAARLTTLLSEADPKVRLASLPLFSRMTTAAAATSAALQRVALEDEDQRVRLGALLTLATLGVDVGTLANSLYLHEADELDRFIAALSLLVAALPVSRDVLEFALKSLNVRKLLLRCGDVPLVDNPRATLALAMSQHPDGALRELALTRELEQLNEEPWLDDATAEAVLLLGRACGGVFNQRAVHLVATRVFGANGSLDLVDVLQRCGLPVDPVVLQKQLGPEYPIGLPARSKPAQKPWWRFW